LLNIPLFIARGFKLKMIPINIPYIYFHEF